MIVDLQPCSYTISQLYIHGHDHNFDFTGPPALAVNVRENATALSTVVQWDEVDDSLNTTYIVSWTSERDHIAYHVTEQSSYTITGLILYTVYTITVTASNRCGQGPEFMTSVSFPTGM